MIDWNALTHDGFMFALGASFGLLAMRVWIRWRWGV